MEFGFYAGDTSKTIYVRLRDSTTGLAKTGLAYNTSGILLSYTLPLAARAAITPATQTVTGAWSSGGFVEIDATNCKGLYRLDLPDAAIASGAFTLISIQFTGVIEETIEIPLYVRKVNVTQLLGTAWLSPGTPGTPDVNVKLISDDATAADNAELFFDGTGYAGGTARLKVDLDTIKTQAVTCSAGVTILASVGTAATSTAQTGDSYGIVNSGTFGNSALKVLIDAVDDLVDTEIATLIAATDTLEARLPAALTADSLMKCDTLRVGGTLQTAGDLAALIAAVPTASIDLANGVETGVTLRQAMRLVLAASAGKLSGAATTTIVIRNATDSKDRITATVDASGNRSAITLDAT